MTLNDTSQCGKINGAQPTFEFIHPHGEIFCSNGWCNAKNHERSQRRWGSTHRLHHIIVVCYYNKSMKYSPFQGEWSHASWHGILCQWWIWQFSALDEGLAWDDVISVRKGFMSKEKTTQNCFYLSLILIFHY